MKITIDTTRKVITLDQEVKLKDLFYFLQDLLKDDWQEYKLEVQTIYRSVPTTTDKIVFPSTVGDFPPYDPPTTPYQPWKGTEIWYTTKYDMNYPDADMQESLDKSLNKGFSDKPTTLNG